MSRLKQLLKLLLGIFLLVFLAVSLPLLLRQTPLEGESQTKAVQPYPAPATEESVAPTATSEQGVPNQPYPAPGQESTPEAQTTARPPACEFHSSDTSPEQPLPLLTSYQFSEPEVLLTSKAAVSIARWLPDGQRLLITRRIPGQSREYIETFNVQTGKLQSYGERHSFDAKLVWLTAAQAVAFVDVSPDKGKVLRISRGEGTPVEEAVTELAAPYLAASPDGQRVVFFTKAAQNQPKAFDVVQAQRRLLSFALPWPSWRDLPALGQQSGPEPYRAAWHPNGSQVAFYNDTGFYLADLATGQLCEVDLGPHVDGKRWTFHVQWSPNGRYLAMLTTVGDPPVNFIDLTLIDTNIGERRTLSPGPYPEPGQHYLYDIAWAANSQQLIALAQTEISQRHPIQKLYLIDVRTGDFQQVMPDYVFGGGAIEGWQLAWSPNGQTLAAKCPTWLETEPTIVEDHICLIQVTLRR